MAISTFYPENRETFAPFFFSQKNLCTIATPLFFFGRQVEKLCHKNKCRSQFWGGKKEKKKKRHPWF